MIGKKFGYLTVIAEAGKYKTGNKMYKCLCICGKEKDIVDTYLKSGRVKSCGCMKEKLRMEAVKKKRIKKSEKLTVDYIHLRIKELRESIIHLNGKTPDVMNKFEYLTYYSAMFRICELLHLINEGE